MPPGRRRQMEPRPLRASPAAPMKGPGATKSLRTDRCHSGQDTRLTAAPDNEISAYASGASMTANTAPPESATRAGDASTPRCDSRSARP
jgi:hypothetical protein